jgi:hypothetical protein
MKNLHTFEEFIMENLNEATTSWSAMMKSVKSGGHKSPWSLVAIEYNRVVDQDIDIKILDQIPARYEAFRAKHPRARIRIENSEGQMVFEK